MEVKRNRKRGKKGYNSEQLMEKEKEKRRESSDK